MPPTRRRSAADVRRHGEAGANLAVDASECLRTLRPVTEPKPVPEPEPLRIEEVFKIGGVPTFTFVEPAEYARLKVALRTPGRGLVVEGPSGIGKSTAVARALGELDVSNKAQSLSARNPGDIGFIELLPTTDDFGTVVIDDFHVLDNDIRGQIADLLKRLADTEAQRSKLIIVGINRAGDSLVDHAPDLANRIDTVRFEVEPNHKVRELVTAGEQVLSIEIEAKDRIVEGAQGSFYLAQLLCHALCTEAGVTEAPVVPTKLDVPYSTVKRNVMERQERRFGRPIMAFVRGTHFRPSGRANYLHILSWLKDAETWAISLPEEMAHHPNEKASVDRSSIEAGLRSSPRQRRSRRSFITTRLPRSYPSRTRSSCFTSATWTGPPSSAAPDSPESRSKRSMTSPSPSQARTGRSLSVFTTTWPKMDSACSTTRPNSTGSWRET